MIPDYLCQRCTKPCGGDVGAAAFVVDREPPLEDGPPHVVLCAVCWDAMAGPYLDECFLDATPQEAV